MEDFKVSDESINLFLVEFHGDDVTSVMYDEKERQHEVRGAKICRIVDRDCQILSNYDQIKDFIDLTPLIIDNAVVVCVTALFGEPRWTKSRVINHSPDSREFVISQMIPCDEEEVLYLDKIYPMYFKNVLIMSQKEK